MRWLVKITGQMDMSLSKLWEIVKNRNTWSAAEELNMTQQLNNKNKITEVQDQISSKANPMNSAVISLGKHSAPPPSPLFSFLLLSQIFFIIELDTSQNISSPSPTHFHLLILLPLDSNSLLLSLLFIYFIFKFTNFLFHMIWPVSNVLTLYLSSHLLYSSAP